MLLARDLWRYCLLFGFSYFVLASALPVITFPARVRESLDMYLDLPYWIQDATLENIWLVGHWLFIMNLFISCMTATKMMMQKRQKLNHPPAGPHSLDKVAFWGLIEAWKWQLRIREMFRRCYNCIIDCYLHRLLHICSVDRYSMYNCDLWISCCMTTDIISPSAQCPVRSISDEVARLDHHLGRHPPVPSLLIDIASTHSCQTLHAALLHYFELVFHL